MSTLEIIATVLSLIYIFLVVQNRATGFVFGLLASVVWGYVSFYTYNLLFDSLLQIFYVGMSVYGLFLWRGDKDQDVVLPITQMTTKEHIITISCGFFLGIGVAYIIGLFYQATWPYLDSLTTAFMMLATYLLVIRKIECWIYFIIADAVYVYIYLEQGATLFAGTMVVFIAMAVVGYWQWGRDLKAA